MAFDITNIVAGDILVTAINTRLAKIKAFLLSIPGGNLKAGSVGNTALEHGRSIFVMETRVEDLSGHTTADILDGIALPQLDGANYSAWKFRSYSAFLRVRTTPSTDSIAVKKNGSTVATLAITSLTAGTPYQTSVSEDTAATADAYTLVYTKVGGSGLTDFSMRLFFSAAHVANS